MYTKNGLAHRWLLIAGHLGVVMFMLACAVFGGGAQLSEDGLFRLEDGVIEVKNEEGDWAPLAADAVFELIGELESADPWIVAGRTLETNESTQIEEGLEVGNLVRVQGTILDDDTWVAYSIELAEEQTDPIIILIGVVDSIDPWVVNGFELNVTDTTDIQGGITTGMIVRVEILLLDDGTWEVLSIAPLGESTETSSCATIIATVVSADGDQIQFLGWPTTVTRDNSAQTEDNDNNNPNEGGEENDNASDENQNDNDEAGDVDVISAGQVILAVVCVSEDGTFVIVQIIILDTGGEDVQDGGTSTEGEKVLVCHKPSKNPHTLSISSSAVPAHLAHGDTLGPCP